MSFIALKLLSTVAVVTGKTKAIEARSSRFTFRVSFYRRLLRTLETLDSQKLVNSMRWKIFHSASVWSVSVSGTEKT